MRRQGRALALAAVLTALAVAAGGCGGGSDESSGGGETTVAAETTEPMTTEETTAETTTEEASTETTESDTGVSKLADKDCIELASVGAKFSEALGTTGQNADFGATTAFFKELVEKAPDEIKDDLATLAKAWGEMASELKGLDLSSGQAPSAETIAKLQKLSAKFDTPKLKQASAHLQAWAAKHCGTGTTP